jgi:hypothetical protein
MSSSSDGRHGGPHDPIRRLRYDDRSAIMERTYGHAPRRAGPGLRAAATPWLGHGTSGRRFVIIAVIALLAIWGSLYLAFRAWRARYRERAAYGAAQVAPAIDAFAAVAPPNVDAARWRDAVARTHDLLVTVTASNLLGLDEMRALRAELERAAARARARPDTAIAELAAVWDDMSERGEFLLRDTRSLESDRHPRPVILPSYGEDRVAPALDPLAAVTPPGVGAARWRDAVDRTRALVLDVTASRLISTLRMKELRRELDRAVARIRDHPESAVDALAAVWDRLVKSGRALYPDRRPSLDGHVRPEIFPPR